MTDTKRGDIVELIATSDEHTRLVPGTRGFVSYIDSLGTVHASWEDGSRLGLIPGEDEWQVVHHHPPSPGVVYSSDIERCPIRSLAAIHYHSDGTCRCQQREDPHQ